MLDVVDAPVMALVGDGIPSVTLLESVATGLEHRRIARLTEGGGAEAAGGTLVPLAVRQRAGRTSSREGHTGGTLGSMPTDLLVDREQLLADDVGS